MIDAEEEEEEIEQPKIDFVPALCFVPRGKAKARPEKIEFTREELAKILADAKEDLTNAAGSADDENDGDGGDVEMDTGNAENESPPDDDEYNFENYDQEVDTAANVANIVEIDELATGNDNDSDSDAEDEIIKPTDNLVLVGHVQDESATMEVWIFNSEEHALYTHHDFILPSFPLCIEWLSHDPGSEKAGNLCAIGCMDPVISVWDLDIQDSIEPTFKLGSKGSKRRNNKPGYGHKDAVLDLSWNKNYEHVLASGSVDKTVQLWDLDEGKPHTIIDSFEKEVQSIQFHPTDAHAILTGSADGIVRLFDCRTMPISEDFSSWQTTDEIENVVWHPTNENHFIFGTGKGFLHYADKREPNKLLWSIEAHVDEISGICFNRECPNLLTSTSADGILKIWKIDANGITGIYSHNFDMGRVQCMSQSPEDPFTFAFGGEKAPHCRLFNIKNFEAVRIVFGIPNVE